MINSQNNIFKIIVGVLSLLGVSLSSFQSIAQEKPRSLVPVFDESLPAAAGAQSKGEAGAGASDNPEVDVFAPQIQSDLGSQPIQGGAGLVVERLDALNPASTGLLSNEDGGFGAQMWSGTPSRLTFALLRGIPNKTQSPQMLDLLRRLLLTGALLPQSNSDADTLLEMRFEKLRSAGLTEDVAELFSRLQFSATTVAHRKMSANVSLLLGKNNEACDLLGRQSVLNNSDPFWIKLDVFCRLLAGDYDKAELSVSLLEEKGEKDPAFYALFARLAGDKNPVNVDMTALTPLYIAMMRQGAVPFNLPNVDAMELENVEAIVTQTHLLGSGGLQAAYRAAEYNRSNIGSLKKALIFFSNKSTETDEPTIFAAYAKLYAALIKDGDATLKVSHMLALWDLAAENDHFPVISNVTIDELLSLKITDRGPEFNGKAMRALLLAGQLDQAVLWERVIRRAATQGNTAERLAGRTDVARLDAFMLISGANAIARWNRSSFSAWKKATENDGAQAAKSELLLSILDIFDHPVAEEDWQDLLLMGVEPTEARVGYAVERSLNNAAQAGRIGETVSLSLLALGGANLRDVSVTTLTTVISSLKSVGLEKEARMLALEAIVAKGF